jgi:hypothetical protein
MGSYCNYCGSRCFVLRVLPTDAPGGHGGRQLAMATCPAGMAHDRQMTGYTHRDCINAITGSR